MLTIEEKISFFEKKLLEEDNSSSYLKNIKEEVYNYFFIYIGDATTIENFSFLNTLKTLNEIEDKVNFIISKIIMHENHSGIEDLINEYLYHL